MKNAIYLLLFVIGMILTSATTATILTVKPATPKYVKSQWFRTERDVDEYVKVNIRQGYIVKTMTMSEYSCYVVMEKY
mgnify:FL=1